MHDWPSIFSEYRPEEWDNWSTDERFEDPTSEACWKAVNFFTSEFDRSEYRWTASEEQGGLGKSRSEHLRWWVEEGSSYDPIYAPSIRRPKVVEEAITNDALQGEEEKS
jgi:hypothetical protein